MYISSKAELARPGTFLWLYPWSRFLELSATATDEKLHAVPEKLATSSVCTSVRYQVLRTPYPLGSLAKT